MKKQTNVIDATQYLEVVRYDKNGEILSRVEKKAVSKNGSGFVISYTEKVCDFLAKTDKASVVRIFLFIAHHQQYGQDGCFGYRCSHKYLEQVLHLNRKTVYEALAELKKAFLVNEARIDGQCEFMVNPDYVTIGSDKKSRVREWNERWARHWKQVNAKKLASPAAQDNGEPEED